VAKASDIPGLTADLPFGEAAARTVAVRARELFEASGDVLDTRDIERVHDMRVATRRLRAVLEIYASCFPPGALEVVLRDVKALADALGARRDPDVQLAGITGMEERPDPADRAGLEAFADRLRAGQAHGNEVLAQALARADEDDLERRLRELVEAAAPSTGAAAA
jgi:CHAD domain-containing protein